MWIYGVVFVLGILVGCFVAGYHLGKKCDGTFMIDGDEDSIKLSKMVIDVDVQQLLTKQCLVLRLVNEHEDL